MRAVFVNIFIKEMNTIFQKQGVKFISIQVTLLLVLTPFLSSAHAQADAIKTKCSRALAQAQSRLESSRDLRIAAQKIYSLKDNYVGYPESSPYAIMFGMEGSAVFSVMNSPKIMTSVAKDLIAQCRDISLVGFNRYKTGYTINIGLIDGKVQGFQCFNQSRADIPVSGKVPWGYAICI